MLLNMFRWTEVLLKKVWEAFWVNCCLQRWFLECIILECFVNFLDDPYYEPLPWFMITILVKTVAHATYIHALPIDYERLENETFEMSQTWPVIY